MQEVCRKVGMTFSLNARQIWEAKGDFSATVVVLTLASLLVLLCDGVPVVGLSNPKLYESYHERHLKFLMLLDA